MKKTLMLLLILSISSLGFSQTDMAITFNNMGTRSLNGGNFSDAIYWYEKAKELTVCSDTDTVSCLFYSTLLRNIAHCYASMESYSEAKSLGEQALELRTRYHHENDIDGIITINNLGSYYLVLGEYEKGVDLLITASEHISSIYGNNSEEYAIALNNIAYGYSQMNNPSLSLETNLEVLRIRENTLDKSHPNYLQSLINVSCNYIEIGEYQEAYNSLSECEKIYLESGQFYPTIESKLYNNLALYNSEMGNLDSALHYYLKAAETAKLVHGEENGTYATILNNIASVYCKMKNYTEALKYADQSLDIRTNLFGTDCLECSESYSVMGMIYYELHDFKKAFEMKGKQVKIMDSYFDKDSPVFIEELMVLSNLSAFFEDSDFPNATAFLQRSMDLNTKNIKYSFQHMTPTQQESYMKSRNILYSQINHALFLCYHHPENDSLMLQTYNAALLSKGLLLSSEIDSRKNDRLEADSSSFDKLSFMNLRYQDIVRKLGDNDVVIDFADNCTYASDVFIGGGYYAFIFRNNWNCPKLIHLGYKEDFDPISFQDYYTGKKAEDYYYRIWSQLAQYLNDGDNIYYSPTGVLHQINLEVLCDSTGTMVSDKYNMNRLSTIRQLCDAREKEMYYNSALFGGLSYDMDTNEMLTNSLCFHDGSYIANRGFVSDATLRSGWRYLPGSKTEIDSISSTLQKHDIKTIVYSGTTGTEEAFKNLSAKHTDILHLATHGFFYRNEEVTRKTFFQSIIDNEMKPDDNSLKRSGLILSGGQNVWEGKALPSNVEDGILLSEEIASMDLSGTSMVVLSACETGLGDITSDGVFGLQRAFKMAGVQTLVMSLWKVDDNATSLMMQTFYEQLLSGKTKREAFNLAQKTVREKYPEPYYWAGFVMLD